MTTNLWRAIAGVSTLALIVAAVLVAWSLLHPIASGEREVRDHTYRQAVVRLEFADFEASGVSVVGDAPAGEVHITRTYRWGGGGPKPRETETWDGQTLRISHDCGDADDDVCSIGYRVRVPKDVAVQANSSSGEVTVTGVGGAVEVETVSGEIELAGLSGELTATSVSGQVSTRDIRSASARVTSVSGEVTLAFVAPPQVVSVRTTSGEARVTVPAGAAYRVDARTGSGGREVGVTSDVGAARAVEVESVSGSVVVGYA
jgi:putative adhesin